MVNLSKVYSKNDELSRIQQNIQVSLNTLESKSLLYSAPVTAGTNTLTITNAPSTISGNPIYFRILINGSTYILPLWQEG